MKEYLKMSDVFKPGIGLRVGVTTCNNLEDNVVVARYIKHACESHDELVAQLEELLAALEQCSDAFEYTRQYVGYETLPPIKGWSWFDADQRAKDAIAKAKGESQ